MKNRPALAMLLFLALPLALARRAPAAPPGPAQGMPVPEPLPWSARGSPGAAAALELLREEGTGPRAAPQKSKSRPVPAPVPPPLPVPLTAGLSAGDMHDFFVGLMGKRAAEPGRAAGRGGSGPAPRCSPGPSAPGEAPLRAA
ncbi:uncharacterized protein M8220_014656 [Acridotheres tristis]